LPGDTGKERAARLPALIFAHAPTAGLRVAALTVLDRLVVAAHRAGASPITIVSSEPLPALERTVALGIPYAVAAAPPAPAGPVLVADGGLLTQATDVRALLQQHARLSTTAGERLPIGVLPRLETDWRAALDRQPALAAQGAAAPVTDLASARAAERMLWASLTSSADGLVDRFFNRPCGRPLSKMLAHTPISPNAVSLVSTGIGLAAAAGFATGAYPAAVAAALLFQLSAIVDCVDGDLARVLFKESPLGKWLDLAGDQVVHVAVFAAIAAGVIRGGGTPWAAWLGASAVLGAAFSFAVVLRGMRRPAGEQGERLKKLIDALTNRDFSVLVLALACFDRLEWFLWLAAVGSHVFWLAALALQLGAASRSQPAR